MLQTRLPLLSIIISVTLASAKTTAAFSLLVGSQSIISSSKTSNFRAKSGSLNNDFRSRENECKKFFKATQLFVTASQSKIDFIGTLENPFDLNPRNVATSMFLKELAGESEPEQLTRDMIEFFQDIAPGRWRVVYVEEVSATIGKLLGDVDQTEIELGNDGSITCHIRYQNQRRKQSGYLSVRGGFGTVTNHLFIKVNDVWTKQLTDENKYDGPYSDGQEVPASVAQKMLERFGKTIFAGVAVVDVVSIDDDLIVFDFQFLGRAQGKRICARKEPDFF